MSNGCVEEARWCLRSFSIDGPRAGTPSHGVHTEPGSLVRRLKCVWELYQLARSQGRRNVRSAKTDWIESAGVVLHAVVLVVLLAGPVFWVLLGDIHAVERATA